MTEEGEHRSHLPDDPLGGTEGAPGGGESADCARARFVEYYKHHRYHESLNGVTPTDVYFGRVKDVLTRREEIKRQTLEARRHQHTPSLWMAA